MSDLSSNWNNEAYVSLHLVQKMLELAGLPPRSAYSRWIPEFKVKVPKLIANGQVVETEKEVDFLVEDLSRYINFLVEVKTANTRIDDTEFLEFLNDKNSDFTLIPGVKKGYAKLIKDNRSYTSLEDMQKKLGVKRSLNWLRAYKQRES